MNSPYWLPFGLVVLAWGVQLTVRGINRTRRSGMGQRAATLGRVVPGAVTIALFGSGLAALWAAEGFGAYTLWMSVPLLLMTMWGAAGLAGGWLRLRDLRLGADEGEEAIAWEVDGDERSHPPPIAGQWAPPHPWGGATEPRRTERRGGRGPGRGHRPGWFERLKLVAVVVVLALVLAAGVYAIATRQTEPGNGPRTCSRVGDEWICDPPLR